MVQGLVVDFEPRLEFPGGRALRKGWQGLLINGGRTHILEMGVSHVMSMALLSDQAQIRTRQPALAAIYDRPACLLWHTAGSSENGRSTQLMCPLLTLRDAIQRIALEWRGTDGHASPPSCGARDGR